MGGSQRPSPNGLRHMGSDYPIGLGRSMPPCGLTAAAFFVLFGVVLRQCRWRYSKARVTADVTAPGPFLCRHPET
jgi:hypothetical protein